MLAHLTTLEIITYRAALALQFVDAVTGQAVSDGLRVRAWAFDAGSPQLAFRADEAERSPNSGVYGFRSLPGLARYQVGEVVTAASLPFIVLVEDALGRFLPQTRRYDLPLATPAVQIVTLFSQPNRPTPTGYGAIRGQLLRTMAPAGDPPEVRVVGPAPWARLTASVPAGVAGDPPVVVQAQADARGTVLALAPYPMLASDALLHEAAWTVTVSVGHEPDAQEVDLELLEQVVPDFDVERIPPLQPTLDSQPNAALFNTVNVVDAAGGVFEVVGATDDEEINFMLSFGRPLVLRTQVDGAPDEPLSELLVGGS